MKLSFIKNINFTLFMFSLTTLPVSLISCSVIHNRSFITSKLYNSNNGYIFIQYKNPYLEGTPIINKIGISKYNIDIAYRHLFNRIFYINGGVGIRWEPVTNNISELVYGIFIGCKQKNGIEYSIELDIPSNNRDIKRIINIRYKNYIRIGAAVESYTSNRIFTEININIEGIIRDLGLIGSIISRFTTIQIIVRNKGDVCITITGGISIGENDEEKGLLEGYKSIDSVLKNNIDERRIKEQTEEDEERQEGIEEKLKEMQTELELLEIESIKKTKNEALIDFNKLTVSMIRRTLEQEFYERIEKTSDELLIELLQSKDKAGLIKKEVEQFTTKVVEEIIKRLVLIEQSIKEANERALEAKQIKLEILSEHFSRSKSKETEVETKAKYDILKPSQLMRIALEEQELKERSEVGVQIIKETLRILIKKSCTKEEEIEEIIKRLELMSKKIKIARELQAQQTVHLEQINEESESEFSSDKYCSPSSKSTTSAESNVKHINPNKRNKFSNLIKLKEVELINS